MSRPIDQIMRFVTWAARYAEADSGFIKYVNDQAAWARKTFGPGKRTAGVIDHITKELAEIERDPSDLSEWVDVIILALDGASRQGYSGDEIVAGLYRKFYRNSQERTWPDYRNFSEDQAIEHVRD